MWSWFKKSAPQFNQSPQLARFHGGLHLAGNKQLSQGRYSELALPERLVVPLGQHIGSSARACVKVGDWVAKGQLIARAPDYISAPVHAPTSGIVQQIADLPVPHASGLSAPCIEIVPDGQERWAPLVPCADFYQLDAASIRNKVRDLGVVGLGGAAFPTAVKLNPTGRQIHTVIINAAECEPYITCDAWLLENQSAEICQGIAILLYAVGAQKAVIAVEKSISQAAYNALNASIAQLDAALGARIALKVIPTIYPTGGEKQLIKVLTGKEVPSLKLPADIGILCQNVATTRAIYRAVVLGEPLLARVVTVTGRVKNPQNVLAPIGTPIYELIAHCGGYQDDAARLIMGGPMMGIALPDDGVPLVKASNCILVQAAAQAPVVEPCIRCGKCAEVCPANLLPQQLYWYSKSQQFSRAVQDFALFDCIECGCCAYVCPSHIPLVQYYRFAKTQVRNQTQAQKKADIAKSRHDARQARLEREQQQKQAALQAKRAQLSSAPAPVQQDAIAAAVARAKERKAELASRKNAAPANQIANPQAEIAAAVARAKARKAELAAQKTAAAAAPDDIGSAKPAVADAVARAKARALAKDTAPDDIGSVKPATAPAAQPSAVADAVAAAKARALAKDKTNDELGSQKTTAPAAKPSAVADAVAAAKARALAKNSAPDELGSAKPSAVADAVAAAKARALAKNTAPDDIGSAKPSAVADAVAAAKARALAKNTAPDDIGSAKPSTVADAVAAAKARALAKQQEKS